MFLAVTESKLKKAELKPYNCLYTVKLLKYALSFQTPELEPKPSLGIIYVDFGTSNPDIRILTVLSISVGGCSSLTCNVTNTGANDQFIINRLDGKMNYFYFHCNSRILLALALMARLPRLSRTRS